METGIKNVEDSVTSITKSLNLSLSESSCFGNPLENISNSIKNLPTIAEGIVLECLEPARNVIDSVENIIESILKINDDLNVKITECRINPICLAKVLADTTNSVIGVTTKVVALPITIQNVVPATEVCLTKAVAVTILNEAQKIASNILNC